MPSKKKKYNARFPAGRIKKIMQTDEEVGKVAQAVPVIISRTLELFVESLLTKTLRITNARNAKTLSPSHMKQCIISESRFDFLRDLVKNIPDIGVNEEQLSGSETGYGNETTAPSPASTSTSSSSNGGSSAVATTATTSGHAEAGSSGFKRSESYTPAGSNYAGVLPIQSSPSQPQSSGNSLKRTLNHVGFYKEISLEETSSSSNSGRGTREPPPKLARLHSAPASATVTSSNAIPFKIDILPGASTSASSSQLPLRSPAASSNYKITYKIDPLVSRDLSTAPLTPTTVTSVNLHQQQPVIKLDYSNLKLPMTSAGPDSQPKHHQQIQQQHPSRAHPLQPTFKIDLSSITNFSSTPSPLPLGPRSSNNNNNNSPSVISIKQVPLNAASTSSTPSTPLSAASSSSGVSSGSSSASNRNPYVFQQSTSATAGITSGGAASSSSASSSLAATSAAPIAPLYSSVSSTIPGMDEDYDDI